MNSLSCRVDSEAATFELGRQLGELAVPGLVIALNGNLGAGKTRFSQAVCAGLGIDRNEVTSPTFVLIQEYHGRLPVYHFDTWRLRDEDEFLEIGADEYLASSGVCLIEWADRMTEVLPRDRITVRIEAVGPESRAIELSAGGRISNEVLSRFVETRQSNADQ